MRALWPRPGVVRHRRAVDSRRRSDRLKGERDVHHGHKDQVEERIGEALIEFGAEPDQINRDAEFEQLDVDSLDLVELAQIAEDEWGVQIKGEDMEGIKTVGQAVDLVTGRMSTRTAVITGVGAITPLGVGARTLHERWTAGASGIEDGVGASSEFEPTDHLSTKEVRRSDRFTQLALAAAGEALDDAGWDELPFEADRVGSVIGTGIGGIGTLERQHVTLRDQGPERVSPLAIPLLMANAASGVLAMRYGLEGQSFGTVSACAASSHSIGMAARLIAYGDADAVVTGGSESTLTPLGHRRLPPNGGHVAERRLRPVRPPPRRLRDGRGRRDPGAGGGVEGARARRRILGRIRGYGATSDAHHLTAPEPNGQGAARAVERALEDAGIGPDDVIYVNAHGTSTPLNDRSETEALKKSLGDERAHQLPVSSTKSAIGHLLGGRRGGDRHAARAPRPGRPPTLNYEEPDEGLDLDYVTDGATPLANGDRPAIAISNSFGFGGHNAVLCLEAVS